MHQLIEPQSAPANRPTKRVPAGPITTLRFKVRPEAAPWLEAAAVEVNQVWNWCNATAYKALRPYSGAGKWLSRIDLCNLSSGATEGFEHIGADTIQRICYEYAAKRRTAKKPRLRWRVSRGSRRSLGWIPLKAASLRRSGKYLRFCGKTIRIFEAERFAGLQNWQSGCFAEDALGDWYLCLPVEQADRTPAPLRAHVGIDLGLKDTAVTSDSDRLAAGRFYRGVERQLGQAQRRGHKRKAKRLHRKGARRRLDALHKFSRKIVNQYQTIDIGDVSGRKLARTRMAKSVLDSGWGLLKAQLQYKGENAGRNVYIVSERNTTRACSSCGAFTGPTGLDMLVVRQWQCVECGDTHDRDVNAASNIAIVGARSRAGNGLLPSVSGNEPDPQTSPPRSAPRLCKAGTATSAGAA